MIYRIYGEVEMRSPLAVRQRHYAYRLQNAGFEKYGLLKDNVLGEISL